MERVALHPSTEIPSAMPHSLSSDLGSLFNDSQGLFGNIEPEPTVEYVASQASLKNELTALQRREETRLNRIRQQKVLISLRKEKIIGTDGYTRSLDDANQMRIQKENSPIDTTLDDEPISEEQLYMAAQEENSCVDRIASLSPDFNEAFFDSNREATTQKEEQKLLDQYEFTSTNETKLPKQHSLIFEKDEIIVQNHFYADTKPVVGKAFAVPSSKSVQRLRRKFGKQ